MEETEREEEIEAYKVILENCYYFHKREPLPAEPWFLKTRNLAFDILNEALKQSHYDHKRLAKKLAKSLIYYKSIKEKEDLKRASLLRESIDVHELVKKIENNKNVITSLEIRIVKSQSTMGPVTVIVNAGKEVHELEEGDNAGLTVDANGSMSLRFVLDNGDEKKEIGDVRVGFRNIIEETHYMKAMEKNELTKEIGKSGKDYQVIVNLKLKLSKNDRLEVLADKDAEINRLLNEKNEDVLIYAGLQESLNITYDENEKEFVSILKKSSKARENCCESCSLF